MYHKTEPNTRELPLHQKISCSSCVNDLELQFLIQSTLLTTVLTQSKSTKT
ncbi:hypothetical protein Hanom_Chr08g00732971 [Helianthus anomalus]